MRHYDEELRELQIQAATKNRLESVLNELRKQKSILEAKVEELSVQKVKEQLDVDHLERRSLSNYFYQVVGKLDEKLTKEKQEAYEAAVKYDAAYSELQAVEADIRAKELEYGKVRRSNERYQEVLKEKQEAVKLSGVPEAAEILRLEAQLTSLDVQLKELEEAISAGKRAEQIADSILESLSSAEGWGTWDLLGGGLIADMAKHSHLDEAQGLVERLQGALRKFKTELADVELNSEIQLETGGFIRFADYFFDGLVADWTVLKRINKAQEKVDEVLKSLDKTIGILGDMYYETDEAMIELKDKLDELVTDTDF